MPAQRHVRVELEQGGKTLILVSDDGSGMGREDAVLALDRHATSKVRSAADLVGVSTFGFRGEALPAIALGLPLHPHHLRRRRHRDGAERDRGPARPGGRRRPSAGHHRGGAGGLLQHAGAPEVSPLGRERDPRGSRGGGHPRARAPRGRLRAPPGRQLPADGAGGPDLEERLRGRVGRGARGQPGAGELRGGRVPDHGIRPAPR